MKLKTIAAAMLIALGANVALANTYNLNELTVGETYLSGAESSVISVPKGSFEDTFNFSLSGLNGFGGSAGVLNFGKFIITAASFSYSLFAVGNTTAIASGANETGFSLSSLNPGNYYLTVSGIATGASGGKYNGVLSVTAVPEPENYAMFLAGLGLIGFMVSRRRIG